ncbi:hypothetical protein [Scatolibacter rhodanostii]|uniref:hypothetical protein n=1 Tax=Scatolibacter rhodanostii TaxID=2014781 RepID=UPI000C08880A|nr:hypothetical protein [Scatolibacter rhodanostii]
MTKIIAPNKQYAGVSAGITFVNGVGETEDEHLIKWFESKGYNIEREEPLPEQEEEPEEEIPAEGVLIEGESQEQEEIPPVQEEVVEIDEAASAEEKKPKSSKRKG